MAQVIQMIDDWSCRHQQGRPFDEPRSKVPVPASVWMPEVMALVDEHQAMRLSRKVAPTHLLMGTDHRRDPETSGCCLPLRGEPSRNKTSG